MATYTVTTASDVVNANDGVLSLREAVAQANASAAADTIVFASNLFFVETNSAANAAALEVHAAGGALTIRGDHDDDGQADVAFIGGFSHHITVRAGANLTLVGVDLINGNGGAQGIAATGAQGARGAIGTVAAPLVNPNGLGAGTYHPILDGDPALNTAERALIAAYHGTDGASATAGGTGVAGAAGAAGRSGAGAIVNGGTLTLIRVGLGDNEGFGETGGTGGRGGDGGFSRNARDGVEGHRGYLGLATPVAHDPTLWAFAGQGQDGGDGGRGGDGGNGGRGGGGGNGGNAAGAILNEAGATLSLTDVVFGGRLVSGYIERGNEAQGGAGGRGGDGGWGSAGGRGGDGGAEGISDMIGLIGPRIEIINGNPTATVDETKIDTDVRSAFAGAGGNGGDGGDGGAAGANGRGGAAAGAVLNLGTLTGHAAVADLNTATAGAGAPLGGGVGTGGQGAAGGAAGLGKQDRSAQLFIPAFTESTAYRAQADAWIAGTNRSPDGIAGAAGVAGAGGAAGAAGQSSAGILTLPSGTQSVTEADALVYVHRLNGSTDATNRISFNIIRIGEVDSALTVNWRIVGTGAAAVTAADFVGGLLPSGTATLQAVTGYTLGGTYDRTAGGLTATSVARIDLDLAAAMAGELREGFRIELTSVSSSSSNVTAALGTAAVTGFVAGVAPPAGPTAGPDSLTGGTGADSIAGLGGNDTLLGLGGNDTLNGGTGADSMIGAAGNDFYYVDSALDRVVEAVGGGSDYVITSVSHTASANVENLLLIGTAANGTGNTGANLITGNAVANLLSGLGANDTLNGGAGNDTLDGGTGIDRLVGGLNDDTYIVDAATDVVVELLSQGIDTVRTGLAAHVLGANVENLVATTAAAHLFTGNTLANAITGHDGADTLNGAAGNDTLDGRGGIDRLVGSTGDDIYLAQAGDGIVEFLNQGADTVVAGGGAGFVLPLNVETLILGDTVANGTGNAGANTLIGGAGANLLQGLGGTDILAGEGGADILIGGSGSDTLAGGAGADQFRLTSLADSTVAAPDLILDFTFVVGTLDRISLALIDANTALAGDQAFTYRGANFTGAAGDLRVQASGGLYVAAGDVNGDSLADFAILIQSATVPGQAWFIL